MRAFVAVEAPSPGAAGGDAAAPTHLTLQFLGEIAPERVPAIADRLRSVAGRHAPFDLRVEGVGAFPSRSSPRVVWFGTTVGRTELSALADDVRTALRADGFVPRDEAFVPHVTWFRVRSSAARRAAIDVLEGRVAVPSPRETRIDRFVLKESRLTTRGPDHRTVATFGLTGSA